MKELFRNKLFIIISLFIILVTFISSSCFASSSFDVSNDNSTHTLSFILPDFNYFVLNYHFTTYSSIIFDFYYSDSEMIITTESGLLSTVDNSNINKIHQNVYFTDDEPQLINVIEFPISYTSSALSNMDLAEYPIFANYNLKNNNGEVVFQAPPQQVEEVTQVTIPAIQQVEEIPQGMNQVLQVIIPIGLIVLSIGFVIYLIKLVIYRLK